MILHDSHQWAAREVADDVGRSKISQGLLSSADAYYLTCKSAREEEKKIHGIVFVGVVLVCS